MNCTKVVDPPIFLHGAVIGFYWPCVSRFDSNFMYSEVSVAIGVTDECLSDNNNSIVKKIQLHFIQAFVRL